MVINKMFARLLCVGVLVWGCGAWAMEEKTVKKEETLKPHPTLTVKRTVNGKEQFVTVTFELNGKDGCPENQLKAYAQISSFEKKNRLLGKVKGESQELRQEKSRILFEVISNVIQGNESLSKEIAQMKEELKTKGDELSQKEQQIKDFTDAKIKQEEGLKKLEEESKKLKEDHANALTTKDSELSTKTKEITDRFKKDLTRSSRVNVVQGVALVTGTLIIAGMADEIWGGQYIKKSVRKLGALLSGFRKAGGHVIPK